MGEKDESAFSDGMSGEQQRMSSKDFYLTKSQVMRRFRGNKLRGDCDENLLGGLLHEMNETQQLLDCMRLPWMKLADAFFQGYVDVPSYSKDKRLLASRLIALMVKLSRETSFVEKWFVYNSFQAKEIKELEVACKMRRLYSISIGDELLYDLSLKQLVEIYDKIIPLFRNLRMMIYVELMWICLFVVLRIKILMVFLTISILTRGRCTLHLPSK